MPRPAEEVEEDVQFTDYAPQCFLRLRETFGLDPEEYLRHLCASIWTESTAGKSTARGVPSHHGGAPCEKNCFQMCNIHKFSHL